METDSIYHSSYVLTSTQAKLQAGSNNTEQEQHVMAWSKISRKAIVGGQLQKERH